MISFKEFILEALAAPGKQLIFDPIVSHFGGDKKSIRSQKWKDHDVRPAANNEKHSIVLKKPYHEVKSHLENNGWKRDDNVMAFTHKDHGHQHRISINSDNYDENKTHLNYFKTSHKSYGDY